MRAILQKIRGQKRWSLTALISFVIVLLFAQSVAYAIARGYTTDDVGLQNGMVVALSADAGTGNRVERASQENSQRVVGVVTNLDNSLVTVASGSAKVLVESEGEVDAYVNDMNGEIKKGDLLIVSPLRGILAKQGDGSGSVIGIAAGDFTTANAETYPIQDGSKTKDVKIAKIKVNLNRQGATNTAKASDSSLSRLGRAIVGKEVSEIRVIIALVIFFIVLVAEGAILYGAISSAITALGRNPLGRKIIHKEMLRVVFIAVAVLLVGLGAVYSVLRI